MTEQQLSQYDALAASTEPADLWRNEVQDRLARYKRRRGRRIEGAFTMRFPFPAEEVPQVTPGETAIAASAAKPTAEPSKSIPPTSVAEASATGVRLFETEQPVVERAPLVQAQAPPVELVLEAPPVYEDVLTRFVDTVSRPHPKRKVIAFPKHLSVAPEPVYRLADPVFAEAPRILDVPEELEAIPATPFLDGMGLDLRVNATAVQQVREHEELPCQPVRIPQRLAAAATDMAIVIASVAVFAAVAYKILEYPQLSKPLWFGLAAATVVLWSAYHYLFLVHAGKTLGMMAVRLRLRGLKGEAPQRKQRRLRVLSMYFSMLSLGMGLMWVFADVDGFCWHDRLSRTFLTRQE